MEAEYVRSPSGKVHAVFPTDSAYTRYVPDGQADPLTFDTWCGAIFAASTLPAGWRETDDDNVTCSNCLRAIRVAGRTGG